MELKLYNTTSSKLNSLNIVGGQLIVSKDDSCLYVDIDSIGRLKITDWIELETDNDRLAVLAPISGKIYYISETNAIWKYVKGSWKCLNEVNKEEIFEYVLENLQSYLDAKVPTSRKVNGKPLTSDITLSASDIGALTTSDIVSVKNEVNDYTDQQIANLLNNSTEAVDSIYELRDAMEDNADAIESLVAISGNKANASDLANHINNKSNPHNVTKEQLGLYASTWYGTKSEYDAIENKQEDCLYIVTDYTADGMYEVVTNKINVINKNSTDEQYPTAKAVYDVVQNSLDHVNDGISSINDTIVDVITSISDVSDVVDSHIVNKENPHNVTAEQIGAVPITGTTLKGQLGINNGYGKVESYDANVLLRTMYPANDSNNSRRITLYNKNNQDDTRYALQLNETINGATTSYNIYGEHNKDLLVKALPIISNPNLLDNWYFGNPVNQNGWTTGSPVYGIALDRWVSNDIKIDINDGFITLSQTGTTNPFFIQRVLTGFYKTISGKLITMSALLNNGELKTTSFKAADYLSGTITGNNVDGMILQSFSYATESGFRIYPDASCSFDIIAVKAELGSEQTLAHQDENGNWVLNEIPNYAEQMAICKQYSPTTGEYFGIQYSNPNLLDNWYFGDPINQRGIVTNQAIAGYGLDRWTCEGGGYFSEFNNDSAKYHFPEQYYGLTQKVDNYNNYAGKTITASLLVQEYTGSICLMIYDGANHYCYNDLISSNGLHTVTVNLPKSISTLWFRIEPRTTETASIKISAAKLEFGSQQTLARQENGVWVLNDPPPNKALELAKCQRYFYSSGKTGAINAYMGTARTVEWVIDNFRLPTTMRTIPTISIYDYNGNYNCVSTWDGGTNGIPVTINVGTVGIGGFNSIRGSFVAGHPYAFHIEASADL